MSPFHDHFSRQAESYARFRPRYPDALFEWLAGRAPGRVLAWDCATGSGQAALGLVPHFRRVVATDASAAQLARALRAPGIEYLRAPAEDSGLDGASADLITVAQALHWFDVDRFYAEAARVLRPGGLLAAWTYAVPRVSPAVDAVLDHYYGVVVGVHWPPERRHVESGYQDLPFPFTEIPAPGFEMTARWGLERLYGYLGTWSATQRCLDATGCDPREAVTDVLSAAWGDAAERAVRWALALRVGRT